MARLNVLKTIEESKRKGINNRYDVDLKGILEVKGNNNNWLAFGSNMFCLGYAQGTKAALSEIKKKECGVI